MEVSSFNDTLPGFLFDEAATSEGECIEIAEWKTVLEKIMGELKKEPQLMEKLESLVNSSLFKDRYAFVGCILSNSTVKKMIGEYAAKSKQQIEMSMSGRKNSTKAASIRLQGNQHFIKKQYRAAFKLYTRGLMFAKDEDEETPLLYANRSATYFNLKQYENALDDIERALKFGYGKIKPTGKLFIRKGFSLLALGRDDQAKELLDANMPANEDEPDFAQWQQLTKQSANVNRQIIKRDITLSQFQDVSKISAALSTGGVFRPHERFPWLNAKVDLCYDAEKGYSLVSKEELKYGEIVALSKPYVSLDLDRDSYERCHYCMVPCFEVPKYFDDKSKLGPEPKLSLDSLRMATPLACPHCSNVLYCSEACRTAAWTAYHRLECYQMPILAKMDSKAHLALRILYMMGSLDIESANQKMVKYWDTIEDHLELMVNQEAYSFVYLNPYSQSTVEKTLPRILAVFFHLKLLYLQRSDLLPEPSYNAHLNGYLHQTSFACGYLLHYLAQVEVNQTVPFTDPLSENTGTPSPVLSVDGMTALMKHSCEATVATSSLLRESFESNVKLLYATGVVPAGTVLTLAYHTEEQPNLEQLLVRKYELLLRYSFKCDCTRCDREERDCLDLYSGVYYPIACVLCGELMVRADGEESQDSWRCSSMDGCNFKYNVQQMKGVYERVGKMLQVYRQLHDVEQIASQPIRDFECKVTKLGTELEEMATLIYGRSLFLAQLYGHLGKGYLLLTVNVPPPARRLPVNVPPEFKYVYSPHLPSALLFTGKALDILADRNLGPCAANFPAADRLLETLLPVVKCALFYCTFSQENEQRRLAELVVSLVSAKDRYEAILKMTAYDTMVASFLRHQK